MYYKLQNQVNQTAKSTGSNSSMLLLLILILISTMLQAPVAQACFPTASNHKNLFFGNSSDDNNDNLDDVKWMKYEVTL